MMTAFRPLAFAASCAALTLTACGPGADETAEDAAPAQSGETAAEGAAAQSDAPREVNVYSARHYSSDQAVYAAFTEATGIEVNLVEAGGDLLIERVRADGERSPADLIITVDAGRLERAEQAGLFQPVGELGENYAALPEHLRHPDDLWFGFATRARVIAYSNERVDPEDVQDYSDLTGEQFQGRVCVRSSNNVYNQSLIAGMIANEGEEAAEDFAAGIVANLARPPQGGDSDQILAIAAGECDVAIVNHYYYARMVGADDPDSAQAAEQVSLSFPTMGEAGTHVNVTGVGLGENAPNEDEARALMEFLLSPVAQRAFAELTNEIPAVPGAEYDNPVLDALTEGFEPDTGNVARLGDYNADAQRIFDRVGWP